MELSYSERRRKMRLVMEYLGYFSHQDLLEHYKNKQIVPGICTDALCDCIINVAYDEEGDLCPYCDTYTIQSICILSGLN